MKTKNKKIKNSLQKKLILSILVFILFFSFKGNLAFGSGGITMGSNVNITSNQTLVNLNATPTITWSFTGGVASCQIFKNNNLLSTSFSGSGNFISSQITESSTYTTKCTVIGGGGGIGSTSVAYIDVNVIGMPTSQISVPGLVRVSSVANVVPPNGTTTIRWSTPDPNPGTALAPYCLISPGGNNYKYPLTGEFQTPLQSSSVTYHISCYANVLGTAIGNLIPNNFANGSINIIVAPLDQIPVVSLTASPSHINLGGGSTISWTSQNSDTCTSMTQGLTINGVSGSSSVSPLNTTTYKISCSHTGAYGTAITDGSVTITVNTTDSISDVLTENATEVTDTSAKLSGSMNPGNLGSVACANVYFRYSPLENNPPIFCNDIYGSKMKATNEYIDENGVKGICGQNSIMGVNITVSNLSPNTTYYYCIVGSNNNQIAYGGVKHFTTKTTSSDNQNSALSVTTNDALVVDTKSAYLNGFYNSNVASNTWFEYGKKGSNYFAWKKVGIKNHNANSSSDISYLLTGLSPSTTYQFRAFIKAGVYNNNTNEEGGVVPNIISFLKNFLGINNAFAANSTGLTGGATVDKTILTGAILEFTTKSKDGTSDSTPGGTPYIDPCNETDDIHCNGSGGGNGIDNSTTISGLPDLVAGATTVSSTVVNTPITLSALIRNQGNGSTVPTIINNNGNTIQPNPNTIHNGGTITSFLNNLFGVNEASALVVNQINNVNDASSNTTNNTKGSFYNFFQISITPQNNAITNINSAIIDLSPVLMSALGSKSSNTTTQVYTFPSIGTYYIRACADKKSSLDTGLIPESYENNNCGPWNNIVIGLTNNNGGGGSGNNNNNNNGGGNGGNGNFTTNPSDLKLGDTATPPGDATVHYHEGIETVLQRQIVANTELAESYGYQQGANIQTFAWDLADLLARTFGYVSSDKKEIRVSIPDIAAYQLYMNNGILTVYEYYNSKIVNIQKMTDTLRSKYEYEYYFKK